MPALTSERRRGSTITLSARSRRWSPRRAIDAAVMFHTGAGERASSGRLLDLSSSGLRLRSRVLLRPGTPIMGTIQLDGCAAAPEFLGEVVRVVEGAEPELAVRFLHVAEPDRARLDRLLAAGRPARTTGLGGGAEARRTTTLRL